MILGVDHLSTNHDYKSEGYSSVASVPVEDGNLFLLLLEVVSLTRSLR